MTSSGCRGHDRPADLQERPRGGHQHVTGPEQVPQRPGPFGADDRRLRLGPVARLRQPGGQRRQPTLVAARQDQGHPAGGQRLRGQPARVAGGAV